jgi:DNA invertase Pin-like site-specific DNA recombinase
MTTNEARNSRVLAAQYLRASSEHQRFSTLSQSQAIAQYATDNNFQVVQTYIDEAKSGLVLKRRLGLQQLLRDVVSDSVSYKAILVYDVSRWGRFLDADESAHYEFLCKSAGVPVHYCAEVFGNDPSLANLIMKAVKRTMAGEYSRELSIRVHRGIERVVRDGFRGGGPPGYGLRRLLVGPDGSRKQQLSLNERKSISSDRVVYELGPPEEVQCVRDIYRMYIEGRMSHSAIARALNDRHVPAHAKSGWTHYIVCSILTKPKYTGSIVYNRTTQYLQGPQKRRPECEWIVVPNAFEAIVDAGTFEKALAVRYSKTWYQSDAQLLDRLRIVLKEEGKLSIKVLAQRPDGPLPSACRRRFGSLARVYKLIGYESKKLPGMDLRSRLYALRKSLMQNLVSMFPRELTMTVPASFRWRTRLRHKTGLMISVRVCRYMWLPTKNQQWVVEHHRNENNSVTLLVLLNSSNTTIEKLVMLPRLPVHRKVAIGSKDPLLTTGVTMIDLTQFLSALEEMRICRRGVSTRKSLKSFDC